jgi:hypothetical protein
MVDNDVSNLDVLDYVLLICLLKVIYVTLDSQPIKAKFVFYCESFGSTALEVIEDLVEISLSLSELIGDQVEQTIVEGVIPEDDSCHCAENVVVVADEDIAAIARRCKSG